MCRLRERCVKNVGRVAPERCEAKLWLRYCSELHANVVMHAGVASCLPMPLHAAGSRLVQTAAGVVYPLDYPPACLLV